MNHEDINPDNWDKMKVIKVNYDKCEFKYYKKGELVCHYKGETPKTMIKIKGAEI